MKGDAYSVSEMAAMFGLTRQTLIYYDRIGLFAPAHVSEEGYRLYEPTQIPFLRLICLMRDLGLELKEIGEALRHPDPHLLVDCLARQEQKLRDEAERLRVKQEGVRERLAFYEEAMYWKDRLGQPQLRCYPERYLVFEPFGKGELCRRVLHTTLMRLLVRLKDQGGVSPFCGWGTLLRHDRFNSENPLDGAGAVAVLPAGMDPSSFGEVRRMPEGIYMCCSRWGMPYDPRGICDFMEHVGNHGLRVLGDACDLCLMDTVSYNEEHKADLCCLQVRVDL